MNSSNTKPKKKYSGLFLENDGLNCFADKVNAKKQQQAAQGAQATQNTSATQETEQNETTTAGNSNVNDGFSTNNSSYNTNNYYNMYNGFPNMFPMMPMMNMMNLQNMMYMDNSRGGNYDNGLNEFMNMPIDQVLEHFDDKIKDQQGCKQLQARIENEKNSSKFFTSIFERIISNFKEYSNDQFANYLCQKIVELSSNDQLGQIVQVLVPDIIEMSNSSHGTRVIQKVIENVENDQLIELILKEFRGHVVDLVMDSNGNHVIQKCLSYFVPEQVDFMYQEIMSKCDEVATHKHGCCVLQRCIDYCNDDQIKSVIGGILNHTDVLINDKYGNYVIQYILELQGYEEDKEEIAKKVAVKVQYYCYEKYSSNVIEKSIKVDMQDVLDSLLKVLESKEELQKMLCHKFGNYVVQTALLRNRSSPKVQIVLNNIKTIIKEINENEFGSKVLQKLQRVFDFYSTQNVKLKDHHDRDNKRKHKGKYHKKRNYRNNNNNNYMMYPMGGMDQSMNQGYVNMNMNLNFNVNLNYPNQQSNLFNNGASQ